MKKSIFISFGLLMAALTGFLFEWPQPGNTVQSSKEPVNSIITNKVTTGKTRQISTEEYQFALSIFEREFPPRDQIVISDGTGIGGAFYVRPTADIDLLDVDVKIMMCMGKYYANCVGSAQSKDVFAHELTHVWQIEHYGYAWFGKEAFCNQIVSLEPYMYKCDVKKTIGDYNAEQQGEIVRHYFGGNECATTIAKKTLSSKTWKLLIGDDGRDATVDEHGNYYMVNTSGLLYKYNSSDWTKLPGSDGKAIAANAGRVCMVNTAGLMYELKNDKWTKMTGSDAKDIAIEADGSVWMVNTDGVIYKYENNQWSVYGANAARISAGKENIWFVDNQGLIYYYIKAGRDSKWKNANGTDGRDISVSNDGNVFLTNTVGKIYQLNGTSWTPLDGSDGRTIGSNSGKLFMVNTAGRLFYRTY
jgi:hypothetical protein